MPDFLLRLTRPTKFMVVSLKDLSLVREFEAEAFFGFHLANAFEEGDEVHLDIMHMQEMVSLDDLRDVFKELSDEQLDAEGMRLRRFKLNLKTGDCSDYPVAGSIPGEFPAWNEAKTGEKIRYTYLATFLENGTPYNFNGLQKIDMETGELKIHDFGAGRFTSEAVFIAAENALTEDDGYLCSIVYNDQRKRSEVVLVDAKDMREEVAVIPLRNHVPFGFHGKFYSDVYE